MSSRCNIFIVATIFVATTCGYSWTPYPTTCDHITRYLSPYDGQYLILVTSHVLLVFPTNSTLDMVPRSVATHVQLLHGGPSTYCTPSTNMPHLTHHQTTTLLLSRILLRPIFKCNFVNWFNISKVKL